MNMIKYPRTHHLPWSKSITDDDKIITDMGGFIGKRVIVTEKMDGENTTMSHFNVHARSLDSVNHPSRNWVKNFWGTIRHNIPQTIRICGENCFAKHSLHYTNLPSYFLGFSAWEENTCLSWDDTIDLFNKLNIIPVKVLYDGVYNEKIIKDLFVNNSLMEGYVVRISGEFTMPDFTKCIGKFVRSNHVQTDIHWMRAPITPNLLGSIML